MSEHEIRLGECIEGMRALPDKSVAIVLTDPPYSEHVHSKSMRGLTVTHRGGARDEIAERRDLGFAHITQEEITAAAEQFARIARRWILVFCDVESSHLWKQALETAGAEYLRTMAWIKIGGAPQFTGDRPAVAFEAIVAAHVPGVRVRWNGGGKAGVYLFPTAIDRDRSGRDERMHTTQKPLRLGEALVTDFSDPDELICDPYAGSATFSCAAKRMGRMSLAFERDPAEYAKAVRRLEATPLWWRAPGRKRRTEKRAPPPKQAPLFSAKPDTEGAA